MAPSPFGETLAGLAPGAAPLVVFLLVSLGVGACFLAWSLRRAEASRHEARLRLVAGATHRGGSEPADPRRRRLVEDTLRELEAKDRARARRNARPTLVGRMRQAGIPWTRSTYLFVSAFVGVAAYVVALNGLRLGLAPALGFGLAAGLALPHLYVSRRRAARLNAFAAEFPNAIEIVVRGVKAGLPLVDCLNIIASEAQEPVRGEFRGIVHDQTLGVPLDEAVERLAGRVPLSETNFFAIVIAIQSRTGGNLSEALGNLAKVLRERKNLRGKIRALSAEAKASAGIIGSMPVVVAVLLYFTSPDYIALLFTTPTGNVTLVASALWMLIGTLVMRKMINFDF